MESSVNQAYPSVESLAAETQPGLIARAGAAVRGAYESWQRHREERRVIGQVALAIGGGVTAVEAVDLASAEPAIAGGNAPLSAEVFNTAPDTPWAIENHPYEGPGSAQASSLKDRCAKKILETPHLVEAKMFNTGTLRQQELIKVSYDAAEGCDSWQRLRKGRLQLKRSGHWINWWEASPTWFSLGVGGSHSNEAQVAGDTEVTTARTIARCVHGHREPARLQVRNLMRNASTGKTVKTGKIKAWPIKFDPDTTPSC